jgi:hypothetical protein
MRERYYRCLFRSDRAARLACQSPMSSVFPQSKSARPTMTAPHAAAFGRTAAADFRTAQRVFAASRSIFRSWEGGVHRMDCRGARSSPYCRQFACRKIRGRINGELRLLWLPLAGAFSYSAFSGRKRMRSGLRPQWPVRDGSCAPSSRILCLPDSPRSTTSA